MGVQDDTLQRRVRYDPAEKDICPEILCESAQANSIITATNSIVVLLLYVIRVYPHLLWGLHGQCIEFRGVDGVEILLLERDVDGDFVLVVRVGFDDAEIVRNLMLCKLVGTLRD